MTGKSTSNRSRGDTVESAETSSLVPRGRTILDDDEIPPAKELYKCVSAEKFLKRLSEYIPAQSHIPKIEAALETATRQHKGQNRESGEPYVIHPISVAYILMDLDMDYETICAGLLHDVLEDTPLNALELETRFGPVITRLVQGVTKIEKIQFSSKAEEQAENLRKMLLAMTDDVRVIIIKLADRFHNMLTLGALPQAKQRRKAKETLDIYVPLAHRLGIYRIKSEMEDLCLRYLEPNVYFDLMRKVAQKRRARQKFVLELKRELQELLEKNGISATIKGRPKTFYSIYKKTLKHGSDLTEVYDLIGLRIITNTVADCYASLGLVHDKWNPLQERIKDYIAVPKPNEYRSLHTTLIHPSGKLFEVQIRTHEMNYVADLGIAAHWSYKEGSPSAADVRARVAWMMEQIKELTEAAKKSETFVNDVKTDFLNEQVYVFTPGGKVVELPAGATPIDFAYAIHTEVGHHCKSAEVDGKMVPLMYELKTGQIVKIFTNKNSKGPSRDWLDVVKSARAKQKIRSWLKRESRESDLNRGSELVHEAIQKRLASLEGTEVTVASILKSEDFAEAMRHYGYIEMESLYIAVGRGEFSITTLLNRLPVFAEAERTRLARKTLESVVSQDEARRITSSKGVLVSGMNDMMVRLCKCCSPIFGDEIAGYITRGRGVAVHRRDCPNLLALLKEEDRSIDVEWDENALGRKTSFLAEIQIHTLDRPNVLLRITKVISQFKLNISTLNARTTTKGQEGLLDCSVYVSNQTQLQNLLSAIRELPEVIDCYRLHPGESKKNTHGGRASRGKGRTASPEKRSRDKRRKPKDSAVDGRTGRNRGR